MKEKKSYLFVTVDGGGNLPQVLGLAGRLRKKGNEVHVLTEPCLESLIREMDCRFIPFTEYFTRTDRKEDLLRDHDATAFSNPVLDHVVFGPSQAVVTQTLEALKSSEADVLVADILLPGALIAAESLQLPRVIAFHMPEYFPGPNRPPGNMGLIPGKGAAGRARDRLFGKLFRKVFNNYKPALNEIRRSLGLAELENTEDLIHSADLRLIQALRSFDFPIEPNPGNVVYTGPYLDSPDWVSPWEPAWSSGEEDPLVVVSFSSTFQNQKQVLQHCLDALGNLPVRGVVTLGLAMEDESFTVPDNVQVTKSAPHDPLFSQAGLVITHGGHGTLMRAFKFGLPVICMPMGRDQGDNAAKVARFGCGIRLNKKAGPIKIARAIRRILDDDTYRNSAAFYRGELERYAKEDAAVRALESLAVKKPEADPKTSGSVHPHPGTVQFSSTGS